MDIKKLRKAGKIVAQVRTEAKEFCKAGKTLLNLMNFCEKRILELNGKIAWAQVSPNDIAAHFCPTETENPIMKKGDLLKIDLGVHIDGWIVDTAICVEVESNEHENLIKASEEALEEAIKVVKAGVKLCDIGSAQEKVAKKYGFKTIRNLSGHNLDQYKIHGGINIPSYDNGNEAELKEGMIIAIEPFITSGDGLIHEKGNSNVFMQTANKNTRSLYGRKLLNQIKERHGLAFSRKEIEAIHGKAVTTIGLRDLLRDGIISAYPPLPEVSQKLVAQTEHTMIVTKDGCEVITR